MRDHASEVTYAHAPLWYRVQINYGVECKTSVLCAQAEGLLRYPEIDPDTVNKYVFIINEKKRIKKVVTERCVRLTWRNPKVVLPF